MASTIKDIAEIANVSRGTVDKVIHNRSGVSSETRAKVLAIIKELDYHPNPIGKALVSSRTPTKIGIVLSPSYNEFMQIMLEGIHHEAKKLKPYGVEVITRMTKEVDPVEELNLLHGMYENNIHNLALFPLDDPYIIEYANQLVQSGTSLITFNSDIPAIHSLWFIGQNHVKGGRTAAQLMEKLLPDGGKLGVIISSEYMTCHRDRLSGFQHRLSDSSAPFVIADVQTNKDQGKKAFTITMKYLKDYPDLKGIYITGGGASGVASALRISGLAGKVKLICHDLMPETAALLSDGSVDFVIDQNPFKQGQLIVQTLYDYSSSRTVPSSQKCSIPIYVRTSESLNDDYLD